MADLQCGRFGLGQLLSRRLKGALLLQNLVRQKATWLSLLW